jgi:hypothetical protein
MIRGSDGEESLWNYEWLVVGVGKEQHENHQRRIAGIPAPTWIV